MICLYLSMVGILLGDIINSRAASGPEEYLSVVREELVTYGEAPSNWQIYRGDSFQLEIENPVDALLAAIRIKAKIKKELGKMDVRISIGIGEKSHKSDLIAESNGEVFINAAEAFDAFKEKKQTLLVKSPWPDFDRTINTMLALGGITMDSWPRAAAEYMNMVLHNNPISQKELSVLLGISQSSVSERLARAHYYEIMAMDEWYRRSVAELMNT